MSLVRANSQWDIVLQDDSRQAVVLYDRYSHRVALANELRDQNFENSQRRCSHCGHLLQDETEVIIENTENNRNRHLLRREIGDGNSSITRDVDYFKLLEYYNNSTVGTPAPGSPVIGINSSSPFGERLRELSTTASVTGTQVHAAPLSPLPPDSPNASINVDDTTTVDGGSGAYHSGISETAFSQGYFDRFFVSQGLLGRGSRGAVYLVEHVLDGVSLGFFALKKVTIGDNHEWLEKVLSEVNLLRMLSHRNLVRYNHVWLETSSLSTFGPLVPCAYILQEYCDGGTLEEYMEIHSHHREEVMGGRDANGATTGSSNTNAAAAASSTSTDSASKKARLRQKLQFANAPKLEMDDDISKLTLEEIVSFMHDITSGVAYLHENQIVHRDLKPSNCLLLKNANTSNGTATAASTGASINLPRVLVSDFGEGQVEGLTRAGTGSTGTLEYCAPELVRRSMQGGLGQFSKKTDIFSLGMILHYLCYSRLPYSNVWQEKGDLEALTNEVRQFEGFNEQVSNSKFHRQDLGPLVGLMESMLSLNPQQRPDANEVLFVIEQFAQQQGMPGRRASMPGSGHLNHVSHAQPSHQTAHGPQRKLLMGPPRTDRFTIQVREAWNKLAQTSESGSRGRYVIKCSLIALKIATMYPMSHNNRALLVLIFLFGIELPLRSLTMSWVLFALHFGVILMSSLSSSFLSSS